MQAMPKKPLMGFSIVLAENEEPAFQVGDLIWVGARSPVGHYRVPSYLRGKRGAIEAIIEPSAVDNEQEGFGLNAGSRRHYYRIAIPMTEVWPDYSGSPRDSLRIEVFETWLQKV